MDEQRFTSITNRYASLRIAIAGDFCLDRYLEIDPAKNEVSIETGRTVYNVIRIRGQPGGAGTILNNLVALGIGTIYPVGFAGEDGEGYELIRALNSKPGIDTRFFLQTKDRRTFTYTKPLLMHLAAPPEELNRLDFKNWIPTPLPLQEQICSGLQELASTVDAIILLDQVDVADTGVITPLVLKTIREMTQCLPGLLVLADSRRGLNGYPPVTLKMNRSEMRHFIGRAEEMDREAILQALQTVASQHGRSVFVTMAEQGMAGASANGKVDYVPALPIRGPIDIVGAGDSVTANLTSALASGANTREALEIAALASSLVIHQLGTTGTASVAQIRELGKETQLIQ